MSRIMDRIDEALKSKTLRKNSPMDMKNQLEEMFENLMFGLEEINIMKEVPMNIKPKIRTIIKMLRDIESDVIKEVE